jgi:signal transduction histidine kinase
MKMRIKYKLITGFGFLFIAILLLWIFSSVYIFKFSSESEGMFKDNYRSVVSAKYMTQTLDELKNSQTRSFFAENNNLDDSLYLEKQKTFERHLQDEEQNITEFGEKELVVQLKGAYRNLMELYNNARADSLLNKQTYFNDLIPAYNDVKNLIVRISEININAIVRKNNQLKAESHNAFISISILGTICFMISFIFLLNFPGNIANQIRQLTNGIKEIARKNYDQQLPFNKGDEFGELAEAFNAMAGKLSEYENSNLSQLLFEKKRIEAVIGKMKDAIIGLNEKKEIIFCNPLAYELLNTKPFYILGKYAPDVAAQNDLLQSIIKDLMNGSYKNNDFSPIKIFSDNKESYFTKDIFDVTSPDSDAKENMLIGYVIILRNITRYYELDEAKTNFIATISHELKTPISSARLNIKLLEDSRIGNLNDEQKNIIGCVKNEMNRLLKITSELLDLTQVETGNMKINCQLVSPGIIMERALEAARSQAEEKKISLNMKCETDLEPVFVDLEKITWVLINFISNAIKYSGVNSEIIIEANPDNDAVVFSVQDFGNGIDAKYLNKVFDKFFKVPGSESSGTGLGLAISKEFISRHKGKIWVESKPGYGSKFFFSLPLTNS